MCGGVGLQLVGRVMQKVCGLYSGSCTITCSYRYFPEASIKSTDVLNQLYNLCKW